MNRCQQIHEHCEMLPGFPSLRLKNLEAIYGTKHVDKSPKGSVDPHIQALVDSINQHEQYVTLSSCSGRIALYDPSCCETISAGTMRDEGEEDGFAHKSSDPAEIADSDRTNGKGGYGGWLFVSHDVVDDEKVLLPFFTKGDAKRTSIDNLSDIEKGYRDFSRSENRICSFKFEPMLLHVAACHLPAAQALLQVALQAGFRESGLIVTDTRITVAIRTHGLSLTVPLHRNNIVVSAGASLVPTSEYLTGLMVEANRRMVTNLERLAKLHGSIEKTLLLDDADAASNATCRVTSFESIPQLQLHGQCSVVITGSQENQNVDILSFGGYGPGPHNKSPRRSDAVYCLRRSAKEWETEWQLVKLTGGNAVPSSRQGSAAVSLSAIQGGSGIKESKDSVILFGGRHGPAEPLNDLWMFDYMGESRSGSFIRPKVHGEPPSPRWGHSLTRLSNKDVILIGGRNEKTTSDDSVFLLRALNNHNQSDDTVIFAWDSIVMENPSLNSDLVWTRRFHHTAVCLDDRQIFIFGGLSSATNLLQAFAVNKNDSDTTGSVVISLDGTTAEDAKFEVCMRLEQVRGTHLSVSEQRFGHTSCLLSTGSSKGKAMVLFTSGGVMKPSSPASPNLGGLVVAEYFPSADCINGGGRKQPQESLPVSWAHQSDASAAADLGTLVHHSCLRLPSNIEADKDSYEFVFVGGGVAGFAFPDCFASSCCMSVRFLLNCHTEGLSVPQNPVYDATKTVTSRASTHATASTGSSCDVVYVVKANAKQLKTRLEDLGLLDRNYRMTSARADGTVLSSDDKSLDISAWIAVPVVREGRVVCDALAAEFGKDNITDLSVSKSDHSYRTGNFGISLATGFGRQICPASSASFARGSRTRKTR